MTNKQYFISLLGFAPSEDFIEGALTDAGVNGASNYVATNSIAIKTASLSGLKLLLSTADIKQGTGETTFSATYDRNAILKAIGFLEEELGLKAGPTITSRRVW